MDKFNLILITDQNNGISKNGKIPWHFTEDLQYFKNRTEHNILIMGRKTYDSFKRPLPNRIHIVITSQSREDTVDTKYVRTFSEAYNLAIIYNREIWVIGGKPVYETALRHYAVGKVYHNIINSDFQCDNHVHLENISWCVIRTADCVNRIDGMSYQISFRIGKVEKSIEQQYLKLLTKIIKSGDYRQTRNGFTFSTFSSVLSMDLQKGFPLLTTKKMFWKGIVEELLFFIRGDTNTKHLEEKGVRIWEGNTNQEFLNKMGFDYPERHMGPMYGYQWRFYGKKYGSDEKGLDQLSQLIQDIKNDPHSRRLLLTDYNPLQAKEGVLYPCHSLIIQFYVEKNSLSCNMYQRSVDTFLGLPFNIASTALLTHIVAKLVGRIPGKVNLHLGDCHIYEEHLSAVRQQLQNDPMELPQIEIPEFTSLTEVEDSNFGDYKLLNYNSHPAIKATMIA